MSEKNIDYKAAYERQQLARARAEDILENKSRELYEKNQSLLDAYNKLKDQKAQLLHQEKLASIGQLSAGVAHEINNPTGFVKSNLSTLKHYTDNFKSLLKSYEHTFSLLESNAKVPEEISENLNAMRKQLDIDYIVEDLDDLLSESLSGLSRIEDIVKGLKSFARPDSKKSEYFNINDCITNTIKLVWNEIKYKADLKTNLNDVPYTCGYPGEICQVILNMLVNASHAIPESGTITVSTEHKDSNIILQISDDGCGISDENVARIFDPFFTTKDVNKGTGLGLSITHGIIKKHEGEIDVITNIDQGTTFTITLPVVEKQSHQQEQTD